MPKNSTAVLYATGRYDLGKRHKAHTDLAAPFLLQQHDGGSTHICLTQNHIHGSHMMIRFGELHSLLRSPVCFEGDNCGYEWQDTSHTSATQSLKHILTTAILQNPDRWADLFATNHETNMKPSSQCTHSMVQVTLLYHWQQTPKVMQKKSCAQCSAPEVGAWFDMSVDWEASSRALSMSTSVTLATCSIFSTRAKQHGLDSLIGSTFSCTGGFMTTMLEGHQS